MNMKLIWKNIYIKNIQIWFAKSLIKINSAADHYSPGLLGWSHDLRRFMALWLQKQIMIIYQHFIRAEKIMVLWEQFMWKKCDERWSSAVQEICRIHKVFPPRNKTTVIIKLFRNFLSNTSILKGNHEKIM